MEPNEPLGPPELPGKARKSITVTKGEGVELEESEAQPAVLAEENYDEPDDLNDLVDNPGDPDGVVAGEEQQKWQAGHPAQNPVMEYQQKRRWPMIILILLVLAAATFGAYWYGNKQASKNHSSSSSGTAAGSTSHRRLPPEPTVAPAKHYDSTTYTLGFDYPEDWTVNDTTDKLTITSPAVRLTTTHGDKDVHVVVTIQNPQSTIPGYPAGGATAALLSQKLTYKQPSAVQRAQTYLSFLGYTSATSLDVLYITGDNGYQQGQQVPMSDVAKGNPLISVAFQTCSSDNCKTGTPTPVSLKANTWANTGVDKQMTDLLESIILD
ncbi:MAG TPA: hypothetical protein VLF69_02330 [Candidatus Saccharimonadales bacterium]|nr:hypothetical protein [Candidatus Saccharimonadales bacterium]